MLVKFTGAIASYERPLIRAGTVAFVVEVKGKVTERKRGVL
ncbi:hypothetical protein JOC85_003059 [Bacillus mesophilus]|nr:hypothetical protein [Bacillus mesophilus]MBM7662252.1 hypothetical protein [Bacillus mesophilus]